MKKNLFLMALSLGLVFSSCVSPNKSRQDYFGYNNLPEVEKKEKSEYDKPYIYSSQDNSDYKRNNQFEQGNIYIFNNYYPYPYEPRFVDFYDPYSFNIFLHIGSRYYDPFWDYRYFCMPYSRSRYYIVHHYPYWDYYWWHRRPYIIYVPMEEHREPKARTVRDFGPSRGSYDYDDRTSPTKESRSSSRSSESPKKQSIRPNETPKTYEEPLREKAPKKFDSPRSDSPKIKEAPKTEPATKHERSSTRPR